MTRLRCAIYTRKSTEEGLDQAFNSLDAQRAACEAYIKSQAGEGWVASKARYDDGGFSGATLERPGLKALIAELEAGRVQIVIVYKVDRLTRSLMDFAKLVERFDAQGVSFVSVTQQFNTTSSMGRLTLNVLLSFAQFEREITAERIRDKIAQSKKKGMWMGGAVPLGYDVKDKKLIVNPAEAETVRTLFRLYLELGSVTLVKQEADRLGLKTKVRKPSARGRPGGAAFTRGHLYWLLETPIYAGDVTHKGERYKGQHEAIVDLEIWDEAQNRLKANAVRRRMASNSKAPSLLVGLLYDEEGQLFRPSHAVKAGRRYRYYISRPKEADDETSELTWRLPAPPLEAVVLQGLSGFLADRLKLAKELGLDHIQPQRLSAVLKTAERIGRDLRTAEPGQQRETLLDLVARVQLGPEQLSIQIRAGALAARLRLDGAMDQSRKALSITLPLQLKRRGVETKLVISNGAAPAAQPNPGLVRLIARAHVWFDDLKTGRARSNRVLTERHQVDHADVARVLPLALLAPDIIEDILEGRQPVELTATRLKRMTDLPLSWEAQRRILGFS
jgi:DNA invertase Pin-like site-specific DNA recombinase